MLQLNSGQTLLVAIIMAFAALNCVKEVCQMFQQVLVLCSTQILFSYNFFANQKTELQFKLILHHCRC